MKASNLIIGLTVLWTVAGWAGPKIGPAAAAFVLLMLVAVTLSVIGAAFLSLFLKGELTFEYAYLVGGFALALPGCLLTRFVFGWHVHQPMEACTATACGNMQLFGPMLLNCLQIAVGMAIVCVPALPLLWKVRRQGGW